MSKTSPAKPPPLPKRDKTVTEELAASQTRTQVLKILDDNDLSELRVVFLQEAPEKSSLATVTRAVLSLKTAIYRLGYDEESPVIEKIDAAIVFRPSSKPPGAPNP